MTLGIMRALAGDFVYVACSVAFTSVPHRETGFGTVMELVIREERRKQAVIGRQN